MQKQTALLHYYTSLSSFMSQRCKSTKNATVLDSHTIWKWYTSSVYGIHTYYMYVTQAKSIVFCANVIPVSITKSFLLQNVSGFYTSIFELVHILVSDIIIKMHLLPFIKTQFAYKTSQWNFEKKL